MRTRSGFARLLPRAVLSSLAVGAVALWASAAQIRHGPTRCIKCQYYRTYLAHKAEFDRYSPRVPSTGIRDAAGRLWTIGGICGHTVRGLDLRRAKWTGANLDGTTFVGCDFRECELGAA